MGIGIDKALLKVDKYQLTSPPGIKKLLEIFNEEGIIINFFSFSRNLNAVYQRTPDGIELLTVRTNLPETQMKFLFACGYAYRVLSQPFNSCTHVKVIMDPLEYELDSEVVDFAAVLLIPPSALPVTGRYIPPSDICSLANVPESLALRRMDIANNHPLWK